MKKYEQLEQQVKEMQAEIERLKKEEEEQQSKLPNGFDRKRALSFLRKPNYSDLSGMFSWKYTSQGESYWNDVWNDLADNDYVGDEVIVKIQEWVIESYVQEHGV